MTDDLFNALGMSRVSPSDPMSLTWETICDRLLPLVHYVAREMFDPCEPVTVVDMSDSDSNPGVITYYVVYCHPSQLSELAEQLDGVARFEPLPVVEPDESETDD